MRKTLLIMIIGLISYNCFAQGVVIRSSPVSATISASNYNKQVIQDANVKIALTLGIPFGNSYTLNNSNPEAGKIFYNTSTGKLGVFNGTSWDVVGSEGYVFGFGLSNTLNTVKIDTNAIRTTLNSWSKSQSDARYLKINDGLTRLDSISVSGLNITILPPVQWRINGQNYSKNIITIISVNATTIGYNRIDLLYANQSGAILRLQGIETTGIALEPLLPANTIRVAPVFISGSIISQPIPDLTDYVKKGEADLSYASISPTGSYIYASPQVSQDESIYLKDGNNIRILNPDGTGTNIQGNNIEITNAFANTSNLLYRDGTRISSNNRKGYIGFDYKNDSDLSQPFRIVNEFGSDVAWKNQTYNKTQVDSIITAALGVTVNSAANPLALTDRGYYNYTGSTNAVWNLPASPTVGRFYRIYNQGTGSDPILTVNTSGSDMFYRGGATTNTTSLMQGENLTLQWSGLYWNVYSN